MNRKSIREYLSPNERALPLEATIDPGFVHQRRIQTLLGPDGMRVIDEHIQQLPPLPDWQRAVRIDHIYKDVFLDFCRIHNVPTLGELLAAGKGRLFCSTEQFAPCPDFFDVTRATSSWVPKGRTDYDVAFEYTTKLVASDTLKSRLHRGAPISVVAGLHSASGKRLVFDPFIMGFPWLRSCDPAWQERIIWWTYGFFENFVEDFDEFSKVNAVEKPKDFSPMKQISERGFKQALGEILGDPVLKDWGGEASDHFTTHLHLKGRRVSAAFLLKGAARFAPMGLNHLGKNNDQIVRLSHEPADVLVVQHCHSISTAVRETLRAFAVRPHAARRYCLFDGRDSLWLLKAYGFYDVAVEWSKRIDSESSRNTEVAG